ncbi:MAG TPA: methyltransferase domain-containing protein [Vicinamibacterales bacterium]|jgi:2-polyprenyl-3-methyl-5-hydroxy-6-metoxy-1,4-benzoquinol methylase
MSRARLVTILATILLAAGVAVTFLWFGALDAGGFVRAHITRLALVAAGVSALTTGNLILRWLRWSFLARRAGLRVPTRESVRLYFATLPAIATPFYVGELVRGLLLNPRMPGAARALTFVWAIERLTDATTLLSFLLVARGQWIWAAAAVAAWIALATLVRGVAPEPAGVELRRPAVLTVLVAASSAAWALPVLGLWWALGMLDRPIGLAAAADSMAAGTLVGGIAGIPLGTGITGSATIVLLERYGVPGVVAAAAVAAFRAGTAWYSLGLGVATLVLHRRKIAAFVGPPRPAEHFNAIASSYRDQIPTHIRERLLDRKVALMQQRLEAAAIVKGARGLDVGCGQGWYACEMAARGFAIEGIDQSSGQIAEAERQVAQGCRARFQAADAERLPWPDGTFDFAYSINVVHHVTPPEKRRRVLNEVVRVLKPGGLFFLHEINVENPLFRFYMSYWFPLLSDIDEGTEEWIKPSRLPRVDGATWLTDVDYFTFLPDFTPRAWLHVLKGVEAWLERSSIRSWSAHYVASLRKA